MSKAEERLCAAKYFRRMYKAHDTIDDIKKRIDKLYLSATRVSPVSDGMPKSPSNPKRFEETIVEMADLRVLGEKLLKERAQFDLFLCLISPEMKNVLEMRCEKYMKWKEIAAILDISISSVKRLYYNVCDLAIEKNIIFHE